MKKIRFFILCVISLSVMIFGSAFMPVTRISTDPPITMKERMNEAKTGSSNILYSPCSLVHPQSNSLSSNDEQPAIAREVPFGPQEDDSRTTMKQWTEGNRNSAELITYTLKRNPGTPQMATMLATTSCTYVADESLQSSQVKGGITQYLKVYYYRYNWVNGSATYKAYWIYKSVEWWTQTSTTYTVGQNATSWTFNGWNCSNVFSNNSSSGGLTPNWQTSTRTYDYIYDFTKNWVTKTPGAPISVGNIIVSEASPGYNNGSSIGTLTTEVRLYGQ